MENHPQANRTKIPHQAHLDKERYMKHQLPWMLLKDSSRKEALAEKEIQWP
jgi:hypothetical protein